MDMVLGLEPDPEHSTSSRAAVRIIPLPEEAAVVFKLLAEESDRGAAVVGAAYVDEQLKALLQAKMVDDKAFNKIVGKRPSSAFCANLAFAMGWIGVRTNYDLEQVRNIRNEFAHLHSPLNFSSPTIRKRCSALEMPKSLPADLVTPKDQYCFTVSILGLQFDQAAKQAKRAPLGTDLYPTAVNRPEE